MQSFVKCRLVDEVAARTIDQAGAWLHLHEALGVNHVACRFGQRAVQAHVVGPRQQCIKRDWFGTHLFNDFWGHEWVVCEYLHFEREASPGEGATNCAKADHADAFAQEFGANELGWMPLAATHRAISLRKVAA